MATKPPATSVAVSNNPNTLSYLSRLTRMGILAVGEEPDRLKSEFALVDKQMEDLAFEHFGSFISSASSIELIREEAEQLAQSAEQVVEALPRLSGACQDFCHRVRGISKSRKVNHKTLRQHSQIIDILELSQLMDTCVKNQHYEEALEIQHHALRLANQHQDIPIIRMIAEEIKESTASMQNQLHLLLSGTLTLPECLRLIGFLKRLGLYSDFELRITYLQCRSSYINSKLSLIPTTNHYQYLSKVIDTTRTQLSEITSQYRAIFDQDDDILPSSSNPHDTTLKSSEDIGSILQCWLFHQIDLFLRNLESKLPLITDGTSISNLLSQCMYFGLSMGRHGADFRSMLAPTFESIILQLAQSQLSVALEIFSLQLKKYRPLLSLAPMLSLDDSAATSQAPPSDDSNGQHQPPSTPTTANHQTTLGTPPLVVMDYMPLAHLLNLLLGTLNELRKCCPYSLMNQITASFEGALLGSVDRLAQFRSQMEGDSEQDRACFQSLCKAFSDHLLPYFCSAYDALWKSSRKILDGTKLRQKVNALLF